MTAEPLAGAAQPAGEERRAAGRRPSGSALRLHLTMVAGVLGCVAATWFEWTRARAGHDLAWAYVVEWPLFAVLGLHVWWKLLHADGPRRPGAAAPTPPADPLPPDPGRVAWEDYLRRLHEVDPPGGPPGETRR
jgi:hypothetical protein